MDGVGNPNFCFCKIIIFKKKLSSWKRRNNKFYCFHKILLIKEDFDAIKKK